MKVWIAMVLGLSLLGMGCSGDDGGGAGDGGGGGASGMGSGGAGGSGAGGASGASGMNGGGMGGAGGFGGVGGAGGDIVVAPAQPDGQVVAPWDQYCVATFTESFDVIDSFGDEVELSIQAGDRYLLGAEGFFDEVTIIYVADAGPVEFELEILDETMLPFTSSCTGATETRIAVFADTVVYSDEALTMPVCTLQAGLTVPGSGVNLFLAGGGYSVQLMGLAAECGGVSDGYVETVHVETDYGGYLGVPFATLLAPAG